MDRDMTPFLRLLKLGAVVDLALLASTFAIAAPDPRVVIPAQILLAVSAYRCLFPNRYLDHVVFHDSPWSSIFTTRLLATFSEVAYIFQFSVVLRVLDAGGTPWVGVLAWAMVAQVTVSQVFVWTAILTRRLDLYFWEELGWFLIFVANTVASAYLLATSEGLGDARTLLVLNVVFGAGYLPWQVLHLRSLLREASDGRGGDAPARVGLALGLREAIALRTPRTDAAAWGGTIGITWMLAYFALLIPPWVTYVAWAISAR